MRAMTSSPLPSLPVVDSHPSDLATGIPYERFLDCVHCGLCTSACPTYLETGNENDSPRGRIYLMRAVTDGRIDLTPAVGRHLDLCLDCRSCETACPSGVQYGRLIEPFRVSMTRASQKRQDWFQKYILHGLFPDASLLRWALWPARLMQQLGLDRVAESLGLTRLLPQRLQRMHRLLPPLKPREAELPELLPAIGERRARVGLFTGCVADAMFQHVHWATARVLQQNGCDVVIPRSQVCCGAIHYHSGAGDPALALARRNIEAFLGQNLDAIIVNVAGCGSMLKDYGHMAEELGATDPSTRQGTEGFAHLVRDVSEFLAALGPRQPKGKIETVAAYHDACHLCHAQQIRKQPRELLSLIPGLQVVPVNEPEICCGAAGSYNLTEPEMSDRLGRRKVENLLTTGASTVVSGNAGCSLQIMAMLKQAGRADVAVVHPMELLDRSYREA